MYNIQTTCKYICLERNRNENIIRDTFAEAETDAGTANENPLVPI